MDKKDLFNMRNLHINKVIDKTVDKTIDRFENPIGRHPDIHMGDDNLLSKPPILEFNFENGKAKSLYNDIEGSVKNAQHNNIDTLEVPNWSEINDYLSFRESGTHVYVSPIEKLNLKETIFVEMVIRPDDIKASRINLLEGQSLPFCFTLRRQGLGYALGCSVCHEYGWPGIRTEKAIVLPNQWAKVGFAFHNNVLYLFYNDEIVAKRNLYSNTIKQINNRKGIFIGTWINGRRNQYYGDIAGVKIWEHLPEHAEKEVNDYIEHKLREPLFNLDLSDPANLDNQGVVMGHTSNIVTGEFSSKKIRAINESIRNWGEVRHSRVFEENYERLIVYKGLKNLLKADSFTVEALVKPGELKYENNEAYLFMGIKIPFDVKIIKQNTGYRLSAQIRGCPVVETEKECLKMNKWQSVSFVYNKNNIVLLLDEKVVARRNLRNYNLSLSLDEEYRINQNDYDEGEPQVSFGNVGASTETQYYGELAGFRVWDFIPAHLAQRVKIARQRYIGEIETKVEELIDYEWMTDKKLPFFKVGKPISSIKNIAGGKVKKYENAEIYWSKKTGPYEVHGAILRKYKELGGPEGVLGFPISDELGKSTHEYRISYFENGGIFFSNKTGAKVIYGEIYKKYLELGGVESFLRLPVSEIKNAQKNKVNSWGGANITTTETVGAYCEFQGGNIYFSENIGAKEVHGGILRKYKELNGYEGKLGFPLTDECGYIKESYNDLSKDERFSVFENGRIYWRRNKGAFAVYGDIYEKYEKDTGGAKGKLGYPESDLEYLSDRKTMYTNFENGVIVYNPSRKKPEVVTEIIVKISEVRAGKIDDGRNWYLIDPDESAELNTYLTLTHNNKYLASSIKDEAAGNRKVINREFKIEKIKADSEINLKIVVKDRDTVTDNDYLGTLYDTFNIENLWGLTGGGNNGAYVNQVATKIGGDAKGFDTLKFDYSVSREYKYDHSKKFREQYWWSFDNKSLPDGLSRDCYTKTFKDVEYRSGIIDKITHPFEALYYKLAYSSLGKNGLCFGMSLEAANAYYNISPFSQPIYKYFWDDNIKQIFSIKHGYQMGDSMVSWLASKIKIKNFEEVDVKDSPSDCLKRVRSNLDKGILSLLSFFKIGGGHTVLAYGFEGNKIFIADPNIPWSEDHKDTYVEILPNNGFEHNKDSDYSSANGKNLIDIPVTRLFGEQKLPSIIKTLDDTLLLQVATLTALGPLGLFAYLATSCGIYLLMSGDVETNGLKMDGRLAEDKGLKQIPILNADEATNLYLGENFIPKQIEFSVKNRDTRSAYYNYSKVGYDFATSGSLNSIGFKAKINAFQGEKTFFISENHTNTPVLDVYSHNSPEECKINYFSPQNNLKGDVHALDIELGVSNELITRVRSNPENSQYDIDCAGMKKGSRITISKKLNNKVSYRNYEIKEDVSAGSYRIIPEDFHENNGKLILEKTNNNGTKKSKTVDVEESPRIK